MPENNEKLWKDAKGRFTPDSLVKPIDKICDELVLKAIERAKQAHKMLAELKFNTFDEIASFVDLSSAEYGITRGGIKGNLRLHSFDGKFRIEVSNADFIDFGHQLHHAKELVDQCLHEWSEDARPEIQVLISGAFDVDKQGNLSTAKILALRRIDIDDAKWKQAMQAIADSMTTSMSKKYVRFYERDEDGGYEAISLDFAKIKAVA